VRRRASPTNPNSSARTVASAAVFAQRGRRTAGNDRQPDGDGFEHVITDSTVGVGVVEERPCKRGFVRKGIILIDQANMHQNLRVPNCHRKG